MKFDRLFKEWSKTFFSVSPRVISRNSLYFNWNETCAFSGNLR